MPLPDFVKLPVPFRLALIVPDEPVTLVTLSVPPCKVPPFTTTLFATACPPKSTTPEPERVTMPEPKEVAVYAVAVPAETVVPPE